MATEVVIKLACNPEQAAQARSALAEARAAIMRFGQEWWPWGNGALAQFNQALAKASGAAISPGMRALFDRAWQLRRITGGLFEPRIGALVELWGFNDMAQLRNVPPERARIEECLAALRGAPDLLDDGGYGPAPGVIWDFGAFGKGYIVDQALDLLGNLGFPGAMVNAGGNLAVRGRQADRDWRIGIRDPRTAAETPALLGTLDARDEAVITHGDDQRFFDHEGRRYAHIIDPRSGLPSRGLRSLTVVHRDAALADAGGAALYVAGQTDWRALAGALGIDQVLLVTETGAVLATEGLAPRLRAAPGISIGVVS